MGWIFLQVKAIGLLVVMSYTQRSLSSALRRSVGVCVCVGQISMRYNNFHPLVRGHHFYYPSCLCLQWAVHDDEHMRVAASDSVTTTHIFVAFMPTCVSARRHSKMHSGANTDPIERNRMRLKKVKVVAGWLYTQ